jgi:hypothetical protein
MGSKSTNIVATQNDESQIQALAAVRGDGNTTQVLDGDAIKQAFTFGTASSANQAASLGEVLKTVDSLSTKFMTSAAENSNATIDALQNGMKTATGSIQTAYSKANSGGLDPQLILLGAGVLALAFIFKG